MEVGGRLHALSASPPGERSPFTHLTGDWVGSGAGVDEVAKKKISSCAANPGRPTRSSVIVLTELPRLIFSNRINKFVDLGTYYLASCLSKLCRNSISKCLAIYTSSDFQ